MNDSLILFTGIFCFAMTMVGVGLTVFAFHNKGESSDEGIATVKPGRAPASPIKIAATRR